MAMLADDENLRLHKHQREPPTRARLLSLDYFLGPVSFSSDCIAWARSSPTAHLLFQKCLIQRPTGYHRLHTLGQS